MRMGGSQDPAGLAAVSPGCQDWQMLLQGLAAVRSSHIPWFGGSQESLRLWGPGEELGLDSG